ncbi:MAG: ATP-binding protein [Bacteroidales bacterium]|nr:ATP-binding protein [Bacteroidales bacterium]
MKLIKRTLYLDKLNELKGTPDIKVITGIRRSGKSKLMQAFVESIKESEDDANIIFIDYAKLEFEFLKDYHKLNDFVESKRRNNVNNYLMIDEVQLCPDFEIAINSLHSSEGYDIYITGSNAFLLSTDLATLFTGRQIEIHVFPFSFREYCEYYSSKDILQDSFDKYVLEGGLSGSYLYNNSANKEEYLKEVFNTIVTRDLIEKYNISDYRILQNMAEYLMDNISNISSPNNIANILTSNKVSISHVTTSRYINFLCNAFLFYKADRYDIRGKKYLESLNKYYLVDTGIRYAILGKRNVDWGRVYENIVYIELLRRNYRVYIGKLYQKEVDFVAMKSNEKMYIQVCDNITDENTFSRETTPLLQIHDAYPKIIIARTKHDDYDYQGIKILDIANWLIADR